MNNIKLEYASNTMSNLILESFTLNDLSNNSSILFTVSLIERLS